MAVRGNAIHKPDSVTVSVTLAGDPQDGGVFFLFIGVPCGAAVMMASSLLLAQRPSATAYVIARG